MLLSACIKLPAVFETFVLSIFEWPLKAGFTVFSLGSLYHELLRKETKAYRNKMSQGAEKSELLKMEPGIAPGPLYYVYQSKHYHFTVKDGFVYWKRFFSSGSAVSTVC